MGEREKSSSSKTSTAVYDVTSNLDRADRRVDSEVEKKAYPAKDSVRVVNDAGRGDSSQGAPGAVSGDEEHAPGLEGWLTVLGAWMIQFTGFGYSNAFGVYQDFFVREYLTHRTSSQISWIGSTQLFILMAMGVLTGRLFDRGYFYHLVVTGSALLIFSLFMLSLAQPEQYYQIFLSLGLGVGLSSGLIYIPSIAVIAHHFRSPSKRALAMGLVASGSSMGGLVHPIMLNNLFHGGVGFANGVRASAGLVAGMQLCAVALMRARYERVPQPVAGSVGLARAAVKFSRDGAYVALATGMMLLAMGLFLPIFYIQLDAIKHGIDATFAFYSLSILNGCSLIGRVVPGFFAHSLGVQNMLSFCGFVCTVLNFAMLGVTTKAGVGVFSALYGFFSGAYVTLIGPMLALLADHPSEIGARMGICFFFVGVGSLIGTPINGALLTTTFIWWRPIVFSGTMCAAGTISFTISKLLVIRRARRKEEQLKC